MGKKKVLGVGLLWIVFLLFCGCDVVFRFGTGDICVDTFCVDLGAMVEETGLVCSDVLITDLGNGSSTVHFYPDSLNVSAIMIEAVSGSNPVKINMQEDGSSIALRILEEESLQTDQKNLNLMELMTVVSRIPLGAIMSDYTTENTKHYVISTDGQQHELHYCDLREYFDCYVYYEGVVVPFEDYRMLCGGEKSDYVAIYCGIEIESKETVTGLETKMYAVVLIPKSLQK